ncbi:MAG: hypothetical protein K9L25_14265 [Methylovulum sp.]|nr:hypothetical protein [Methylovulum sp.]
MNIQYIESLKCLSVSELRKEALHHRERNELQKAEIAFSYGMEHFPNELDQYGHPTFRKELMRMLLNQREWRRSTALIPVDTEIGGSVWFEVLFARAYTQANDIDNARNWWQRIRQHPEAKEWLEKNDLKSKVSNQLMVNTQHSS